MFLRFFRGGRGGGGGGGGGGGQENFEEGGTQAQTQIVYIQTDIHRLQTHRHTYTGTSTHTQ